MLKNIDHINIVVTDLERSVEFYTKILGFTEKRRGHLEGEWIESVTGIKNICADVVFISIESGPRIELLCYKTPEGKTYDANSLPNTTGLRHIAFQVDDMESAVKRLKDAGVRIVGGPASVPESVINHDSGRKTLCYFLDPDGTLLELAHYSIL
jgi:catechol 2,3-dioxygenase-like lactoylglutathione lyase family enzyme